MNKSKTELDEFIEERLRFTKKKMKEDGKLKQIQSKKYVMYYIFYDNEPIYIGITNNFERRKHEHFSEKYRNEELEKMLYKHMLEHDIDKYEMFIVIESNSSKTIENFEISHIRNLRHLKFNIKNTSSGGGYSQSVNRIIKDNINKFISTFEKIEGLAIENYNDIYFEVDIEKLEKYINNLDWDLLRSAISYSTINRVVAYDDYLRRVSKKRDIEFEDYSKLLYTIPDTLSVESFFFEVGDGGLVSDTGKSSVINRFIDLVNQLEVSKDPIEVFVSIKLLMGYRYQEDILPIIDDGYHDSWDYYDLEDYIKGYGSEAEEDYWYYKGEFGQ